METVTVYGTQDLTNALAQLGQLRQGGVYGLPGGMVCADVSVSDLGLLQPSSAIVGIKESHTLAC